MRAAAEPQPAETIHPRRRALFWPVLRTMLLAAVLAYAFRAFIAEPYSVPSASMAPTILPGDHLLVEKWAYGYNAHSLPFAKGDLSFSLGGDLPERGDVVVFADPNGGERYFVKRVIGLPGDTLSGRSDGSVILNGQPLADAGERLDLTETLPDGRRFHVRDSIEDGPLDRFDTVHVPVGHLFVLGDNRDQSEDSRVGRERGGFGLVPVEYVVGRAAFILLPAPSPSGERFARLGRIQ